MNLLLHSQFTIHNLPLKISGSKSETNRLLMLQALYPDIALENISDSDDSDVMVKAFENSRLQASASHLIDIHHAGTAMRFLAAYFAIQEGRTTVLTGSPRMKERPISILVDALRELGAEITYAEKEGFPPLKIMGKKLTKNKVSLNANVSSQYISALLLIAPKLENGLQLTLEGEITSRPYIEMTLRLLDQIGIATFFSDNKIVINQQSTINNQQSVIESDWSSASYFYSIAALSATGTAITLSTFKKDSLQGDSILAEIYKNFGVDTVFNTDDSIVLTKVDNFLLPASYFTLNLNASPDLAQTIAATCFGLGIGCHLTGLHTLKIKETDRLQALKNELEKLGALVSITADSIRLEAANTINPNVRIATYQDHRMAMAFAPLAIKAPIVIEDAEVVSKSYPAFWEDLERIGFAVETVK